VIELSLENVVGHRIVSFKSPGDHISVTRKKTWLSLACISSFITVTESIAGAKLGVNIFKFAAYTGKHYIFQLILLVFSLVMHNYRVAQKIGTIKWHHFCTPNNFIKY